MFWFSDLEACGALAPLPGIEPVPPALKGEVIPLDCQGSPYLFILIDYGVEKGMAIHSSILA